MTGIPGSYPGYTIVTLDPGIFLAQKYQIRYLGFSNKIKFDIFKMNF